MIIPDAVFRSGDLVFTDAWTDETAGPMVGVLRPDGEAVDLLPLGDAQVRYAEEFEQLRELVQKLAV